MNGKSANILSSIICIVFVVGLVMLGIHNYKNNEKFFDTSLTTLLTIAVAVIISYFFVQKRTDNRRKNEKIDNLLYKIQKYINEDNFVLTGGEISRKNLILHKAIANEIRCIKNMNLDKESRKQIARVERYFKDFREVYGENYPNEERIEEKYSELKNYVVNIDDACDRIHMHLM
ncbi:MAG: hypothetical protein UFJ18_11190 [Blautia sp.]|nr:hypothetical protein [Blautia sp.]